MSDKNVFKRHENLNKVYKIVSDTLEDFKNSSNNRGDFNNLIKIFNKRFNLNIEASKNNKLNVNDTESIYGLIKDGLVSKYLSENDLKGKSIIKPIFKKDNKYLLSSVQKRMFVLYKLEPDSPFYNVSEVDVIRGKLDLQNLEKTFHKLQKRHEIIRSHRPNMYLKIYLG
jgi:hypothetical protein